MKAFKLRVVCYGGKWRYFSLECTSVGQNCILIQCIFSCAINMCVLDRVLCGYVIHSWQYVSQHPRAICGSQVPVEASLVLFFFQALIVCNWKQRGGHTAATLTVPHNRARYKDVTFLWFLKAFNSKDIFFCFHFAFRVPYIYACFYNVSFNMLMYPFE